MKRLLLSILLALGLHAVILSADLSWLKLASQAALKSSSLAIVLSPAISHTSRSEADSLPVKQSAPKADAAENKIAQKQPGPNLIARPQKNLDSLQNFATLMPEKNLKALPFKKPSIKAIETLQPALIDKRHFSPAAEAKTGAPSNSGAQPLGLPIAADRGFIKKTHSLPGGSSESLTTAAAVPATKAGEILSESPGVVIARPLYKLNPSPGYPLRARRMGYEGLVMLKVQVDEYGRVDDLEILKSSGYAVLDQAAISSVRKWLFEPGTEGGNKKKMWVKIPIRFELE